jgi:hypothetical protein
VDAPLDFRSVVNYLRTHFVCCKKLRPVLGAGFVDVMDGNELGMAIPVGFY